MTLDIDATEIIAHKADAKWTYNKNKGFMPMVGHIAETGQVVAVDFRQGNVPPAQDNLAFIQQCQQSLPEGCALNALRIDAAGYQTKIIEYCDTQGIEYAIRAKTSAPSGNDPALAFVGHRGKSRQNGTATICKTAGKTPNIVGTRATCTEGV